MTESGVQLQPLKTASAAAEEEEDDVEDVPLDRGLLRPSKRIRIRHEEEEHKGEWLRACWLGLGLFLVLFSFWLLDSLKDPIFGALVDGNLDEHQPRAKLLSVGTTLLLVCAMEFLSNSNQNEEQQRPDEDVADGGGRWSRMELATSAQQQQQQATKDPFSSRIFLYVCLPYCVFFGVMASLLQFNARVALMDPSELDDFSMDGTATTASVPAKSTDDVTYWYVVGYCLYAAIESFGSIAVATYWSYLNSSLSLQDAEKLYGMIIGIAQLGAILGSTMVTTHIWSSITLIVLACLIIILHVLVMRVYSRKFAPTNTAAATTPAVTHDDNINSMWSGVLLILRHNYVLLILGASCLYEVSLTCLDYQMTLLGWSRFEESDHSMSFKQFRGHYGQMVNISSLCLSSIVFPWLIRKYGLRITIRLFPTLLLAANVVAFGALPGNLAVLFFSMSLLKAMTYSIHDPSKEILYIPTSNEIKFKSKFWIDVVGARFAKATGSTINRYSGSVDRSIRVASAPSLLTALALWWVCYRVGKEFDSLVESDTVVGESQRDTTTSSERRLLALDDDTDYNDEHLGYKESEDTLLVGEQAAGGKETTGELKE